MKKLIIYSAAIAAGAVLSERKAYAWFGKTHKEILEKAFELLEKQDDKSFYDFFIGYKNIMLKACTEPDNKGDIDKGSGMHYYCAANKKGKPLEEVNGYYRNRLRKYNRSARTMLEENYTMALSLYKSGNLNMAMHMLGRALHFIGDIGCTVHSSGIRYMSRDTNPHYAFEKYAQGRSDIPSADSINKRIRKMCDGSLEQSANKLAAYSSKFTEFVRKVDPELFDDICSSTIPVAQQYTACLMIRFYNDVKNDNGNFLLDGKEYTFKNEKTSGLMTVTAKRIILDAADESQTQRLTVKLKTDGSFILIAGEKGIAGGCLKGFISEPDSKAATGFRAAALGNRRFRITTEANSFKKVITVNGRGQPVIKPFSPKDKGAVWIINRAR